MFFVQLLNFWFKFYKRKKKKPRKEEISVYPYNKRQFEYWATYLEPSNKSINTFLLLAGPRLSKNKYLRQLWLWNANIFVSNSLKKKRDTINILFYSSLTFRYIWWTKYVFVLNKLKEKQKPGKLILKKYFKVGKYFWNPTI